MQGVVTDPNGTGKKAKFPFDMPIAGKTGTTSENKDLTFVGYTPYYVAGIWTGYDMPAPLNNAGSYHLDLWRKVMEEIHQDLEPKEFEMPLDSVAEVRVCMDSGLLVSDLCLRDGRGSRGISQIFERGKEPTETCNVHAIVTYDTSTGMRASEYCPDEYKRTITGIVVPDSQVSDWTYQIAESIYNGPTCIYHTGFRFSDQPPSYITPDPNQWSTEAPPPAETPLPGDFFATGAPEENPAEPAEDAQIEAPDLSNPTQEALLEYPEDDVQEYTEEPGIRLEGNPENPVIDLPASVDDYAQ
jgi:penicillin-binding protein 1A